MTRPPARRGQPSAVILGQSGNRATAAIGLERNGIKFSTTLPATGHSGLVACSRPGARRDYQGSKLRRPQVKIVGQKRPKAGRGKRRGGHFPRPGTKPRLESRPGLIVGQPRRNAPFLTHDHRWIPYGGIRRRDRRELNGRDSPLVAPASHGQKGHSSRVAGVSGRRHEDGGSLHALWGVKRSTILATTTGRPGRPGRPVCPGGGAAKITRRPGGGRTGDGPGSATSV